MNNSIEEIEKLRMKADVSMHKTAQLRQIMAQNEANLSRIEIQKVKEKTQKKNSLCQEVSNLEFLFTSYEN